MLRKTLAAAAMVVSLASTASAQSWADRLVVDKEHNFGTVARAAKAEHVFVLKNDTNQTVHISGVRSSCGCTQPRVEQDTAAPGESASIVAAFNTRGFTGKRGAWVTITLDRPQYAEVRVRVDGYIRTDVVVDPGQVNFGTVTQGAPAEKHVNINYAGRPDWTISEVKGASPFVDASVKETVRNGNRVSYELIVKLKDNAPAGYLGDELQLVTNDRRSQSVPVRIEGRVVANLAISPSPLMLGTIQPNAEVKRQLIIKGAKPFTITEIIAEDAGFTFSPSQEAKMVHVVPVLFTAGDTAQLLRGRIIVKTDLPESSEASIEVKGQVTAPLAGTN